MTQQEIKELRINAEAMSLMEMLCDDVRDVAKKYVSALERLEKLEAAVAWHGWDELPEKSGVVDLKCNTGAIVHTYGFRIDEKYFYNGFNFELFNADEMIRKGFTGWRYPVGDLSEKIKLKVQSKQNSVEAQLEDDLISGRIPFLSGEGIVPGSLRIAKGDNQ